MSRGKPAVWLDIPRLAVFPNFLSDDECDYLVERAKPKLTRSTVVAGEDKLDMVHEGRTSSGCCFERGETEKITTIERKLAMLTATPLENGEGLQVLRYEEDQYYRPHHDYFDPTLPGYDKYLERGGQRLYTVIMYLNDDFDQGETEFPILRMLIPPIKGSALVFANVAPNGRIDDQTLHGGREPKNGTKYIATKWIRQGVY